MKGNRASTQPTALVLAGQRGTADPVARFAGTPLKAFARIGGETLLERVVGTLAESGLFRRISISLPTGTDLLTTCPKLAPRLETGELATLEAAPTPASSVRDALDQAGPDTPLCLTTADHPLLTSEMLREFIRAFGASGADAAAALTPVKVIRRHYPDTQRTGIKFREGHHTGCNLFALSGARGLPVVDFWRKVERLRKNPLRMASTLGITVLLRYAMGQMSFQQARQTLEKRTGAQLTWVILPQPEAGMDVDTPADLVRARRILEKQDRSE